MTVTASLAHDADEAQTEDYQPARCNRALK